MTRHFGNPTPSTTFRVERPGGSPPITRPVPRMRIGDVATIAASVLLAFFVLLLFYVATARAQSSPGFIDGQVPTAAQWNQAFKDKQNTLGFTALNRAGDVMTGPLRFAMPLPGISCNGTGTPSVVGNRQAGTLTTGTSSTTCTLTWDTAYPATPSCHATWRANLASMGYTPSPTGLVITQTSASGAVIDYSCTGLQ